MIENKHVIPKEDLIDLLDNAILIATTAHLHQKDKAGMPYILHPLRVMFAVNTLEQKIAAILHDIIEDTHITLMDLENAGLHYSIIYTLN